jgi:hypothetical protein
MSFTNVVSGNGKQHVPAASESKNTAGTGIGRPPSSVAAYAPAASAQCASCLAMAWNFSGEMCTSPATNT